MTTKRWHDINNTWMYNSQVNTKDYNSTYAIDL